MTVAEHPRRGEVCWVDFGRSVGREIRERRTAMVVSNDAANAARNRVQAVPLTSSTARLDPSKAYVTVAGHRSKAMADRLATASKDRPGERLDRLGAADLGAVERAIRTQLGL